MNIKGKSMEKLVIASGNAGKLREIARILEPLAIVAAPQSDFGVPECPEPHVTFVENCLAKARHASAHTGLPALADDSGICVEALLDLATAGIAQISAAQHQALAA